MTTVRVWKRPEKSYEKAIRLSKERREKKPTGYKEEKLP